MRNGAMIMDMVKVVLFCAYIFHNSIQMVVKLAIPDIIINGTAAAAKPSCAPVIFIFYFFCKQKV
jgi:LytS/YehU family sensor histidine kinase